MHQLTTPQQERLRRLVRRSPAFIGMKVAVREDHVEVLHPEQLVLGLDTLSGLVADAPTGQWPDVVDEYLTKVMELGTRDPVELTGPTEDLLDKVYQRLIVPPAPPAELPEYAVEAVPGLMLVLSLDLPEAVLTIGDEHVHRHGFDRMADAGLVNLTRELPDRYGESDGVYVLQGSVYVGSLVLVLPWVIEMVTGLTETPHGVLVAMPSREGLVFHVIRERPQTERALEEMARLTAEWHAESTHWLSHRVFWSCPTGGIEPVAHYDGTRMVDYYSNEFGDMLYDVDREWD